MGKQKQHKKVYIDGLVMPENCNKCPFCDTIDYMDVDGFECRIGGHNIQNLQKREHCPLKEGAF